MSIQNRVHRSLIAATLVVCGSLIFGPSAVANEMVTVNIDNFVRAETAAQIDRTLKMTGGVNKWGHNRQPTPLDRQNVIRMNRDTLYSFTIVDISKGRYSHTSRPRQALYVIDGGQRGSLHQQGLS